MAASSLWQPALEGKQVRLRPLQETDFAALFRAASDPAIWAMHPEPERHTHALFKRYFDSGIASGGALLAEDARSGAVIGSSRFADHDPAERSVEIGYTFLARSHWGTGCNAEMKALMLAHAFELVDSVLFYVGIDNLISRKAVAKLGAMAISRRETISLDGRPVTSIIYELRRPGSAPRG